MIRVMLVDDSPLVLHILQRLLSSSPGIVVAGTAANGLEALELLPALQPDVICTDLHMPVMDGLELTRAVMEKYPRPILVVSMSVEPDSHNVFTLLEAGAVDIFPKPRDILAVGQDSIAKEFARKIRILAGVRVTRRKSHRAAASPVALPHLQVHMRIVVIGASTGGPQALHDILSALPANFPLPVVCVQHIGSNFVNEMVSWLSDSCSMPVRCAVHDEIAKSGVVYVAPGDVHLEINGGRFAFCHAPPVDGHLPSITVTMNSAARCFGAGTVGVLLTGMGSDGAEGMLSIHAAGGITLAQDEESCVVYGMPKVAVGLGAVQYILPLEQIAFMLQTIAKRGDK